VSGVVNQKRRHEFLAEPAAAESRVTPVMPVPNWLRALDENEPPRDMSTTPSDADESVFWDTPPRYSVTNLASLAPAPLVRAPSPWRIWSARLLFAIISCVIVVLLGFELRSLSEHAPVTPTRALLSSALPKNAP